MNCGIIRNARTTTLALNSNTGSRCSGAYFDKTTLLRLCGGSCIFICRPDLCAVVCR